MELTSQQQALALQCLRELQQLNGDLEGVVFASSGGFPLASTLADIESLERFTALSTVMRLLCKEAYQALRGAEMDSVYLKFEGCFWMVYPIGTRAALIFIQKPLTKIGGERFWLQEVPRAAQYLETLIEAS